MLCLLDGPGALVSQTAVHTVETDLFVQLGGRLVLLKIISGYQKGFSILWSYHLWYKPQHVASQVIFDADKYFFYQHRAQGKSELGGNKILRH